jgi:demethylsterigmatocystin 6-O-methyltransferase
MTSTLHSPSKVACLCKIGVPTIDKKTGAKFYYLRYVLHDWPDEKCRSILKTIVNAMDDDSIILIDEMVLPDQGVNWQVAQIDLTMLVAHAAMERTETQWSNLFDSVGLTLSRRDTYTPAVYEAVTALVRK